MSYSKQQIQNAWKMYDWANSVYILVVLTTVFPIYFSSVAPVEVEWGSIVWKSETLYTLTVSLSYIVVSLLSPLLSARADRYGTRRTFLFMFLLLGSSTCLGLFFFDAQSWVYGLGMCLLSSIGFNGSLVFYNAYLSEIAEKEEQDDLSAKGFAWGYLGGFILQVIVLLLIQNAAQIGCSKGEATRVSFVLVGFWWMIFGVYSAARLPRNTPLSPESVERNPLRIAWKKMKVNPVMRRFLGAFFLYSVGVQTVVLIATLFGEKVLHIPTENLILVILIIQIVALLGTMLFSKLSERFGNIRAILVAVLVWCIVTLGVTLIHSATAYYVLAIAVGFVLGGIQSLSRSTYSKTLETQGVKTALFSLYDILEKWSIVLGTLTFALLSQVFNMRIAALFLSLFFFAAFLVLWKLRDSSVFSRNKEA